MPRAKPCACPAGDPCEKCLNRERVRRLTALGYYRKMTPTALARLIESTKARIPLMRRVLREMTK